MLPEGLPLTVYDYGKIHWESQRSVKLNMNDIEMDLD